MRKNARASFLILILLSLFIPVNAETPALSFYTKTGIASPVEGHIRSGLSGAFGLSYHLGNRISVSIDLGSWKSPVDQKPQDLFKGKITQTPLLISLKYSFSLDHRIFPNAIIGGGYVFTHFRMDDIITIPEITISQEVMSGLCLHAGLGALVKISKSFGMICEAVYLFRKPKGVTTITDMNFGSSSEEFFIRLHTILYQVGVVYSLD